MLCTLFSRSLKDLMSAFNSTANLLLDHLSTMADAKTEVCMADEFARAALDVICKVSSKINKSTCMRTSSNVSQFMTGLDGVCFSEVCLF